MTGLLTTREVAQRLHLHPQTILDWVRAGDLPAFKLPSGAIRFSEEALDAWLQGRATSRRGVSTTTPDAAPASIYLTSSTTTEDEED